MTDIPEDFFQVAEYTAVNLYRTTAQHTAPKFLESDWVKIIKATELAESSREETEEARIRARLEKWYEQTVNTPTVRPEDQGQYYILRAILFSHAQFSKINEILVH